MSNQSQNSNTPRFRHRTGFAAVSNDVIRDTSLSLKAKGLFALIQSYITNESLIVTKAFLQEKCTEGEVSDGELRETQMTNYFSNLYPIDCAVLSVNAQSYRKYGTLPEHEFLPEI